MTQVTDLHVAANVPLPSPHSLLEEIPRSGEQSQQLAQWRESIHGIISGEDDRFLLIVGPCSIHDREAGLEYAARLAELARQVEDRLFLVMRVYFEKPRTTVGWKGLIMDPHLDGSNDIAAGLHLARQLLCEVLDLGLPTATELLDPITPQYIADLVCWSAIGARTTESQTHRQMASGLSMPLGFKNGTDGSIKTAINAIKAASQQQTFLGVDAKGAASAVTTRGNPNCHIVLRGGSAGPNYEEACVSDVANRLREAGLVPAVMTDCSHDNSGKDPARQPEVFDNLIEQACNPTSPLIGAMLESNLVAGKQTFPQPRETLQYGLSITDGCLDWETTERILREGE